MTLFLPSLAHAQGAGICEDGFENVATPAPTAGITSNMGYRSLCERGAGSCWHKGTDYGTACGTTIPGPPVGCTSLSGDRTPQAGGYGYTAKFDCGTNNAGKKIMIQYAHLQGPSSYNSSSNTIVTGNSGVGGCHLDYIMTVDGKVVDAQCATGNVTGAYTYGNSSRKSGPQCPQSGQVNICDPAFGDALRKHSDEKFAGSGGKNNYDIANGTTSDGGSNSGADPSSQEGFDSGDPTTVLQGTQSGPQGGIPVPPGPIEEPQPPIYPEPQGDPEPKYDPTALKPRCQSSTCISQDHIDNAKHKNVQDDKVKSHVDLLTPTQACAEGDLQKTNVTVFKKDPDKASGLDEYDDAFCLRQGCAYVDKKCQ